MTVYEGRPVDCTGRLEKEIRTYDFLDKLQIPYVRIDHEAAMTMEACAAGNEALGGIVCKTFCCATANAPNFIFC